MKPALLVIIASLFLGVAFLGARPPSSSAQCYAAFCYPTPTQSGSGCTAATYCQPTNQCGASFTYCVPNQTQPKPPTPAPPIETPPPVQTQKPPVYYPTTAPSSYVICGNQLIPATQPCFQIQVPQQTAVSSFATALPQTTPRPVATPPTRTPTTGGNPPPASVAITGKNPVTITLHANQFLDLTHSVVLNLDPGLQATGVQVSSGSASIQGSQVVWNGFTMNAGDEASVVVSLAATGGSVLTGSGAPAIQSVSITALDQSGNSINYSVPGTGGPTVNDVISNPVPPLQPRTPVAPRPPPPAVVTISRGNPVTVTIHANQSLNFGGATSAIGINLDPEVQAASVSVSSGSASIQGGKIVWNPATLGAGSDASAVISLAASGAPAIQTVAFNAVDQAGSPLQLQTPGVSPTISDVALGCPANISPGNVVCGGMPPLTVAPSTSSAGDPPPARLSFSGRNPVLVTVHANQFLDFTNPSSSIRLNLDPGVQATRVEVSTGAPTLQDSGVLWNGFTLNAGDDATATVTMAASASPAIPSIGLDAVDLSGSPVSFQTPGSAPTVSDVASACAAGAGPVMLSCSGIGDFVSIPFSMTGSWRLAWRFGLCPDAKSPANVWLLNPDASIWDSPLVNPVSGETSGSQSYQVDASFLLAVSSPCGWAVELQQP